MKTFFQKKYANYILKPFLKKYLRKARDYKYGGLVLKIYPSVFHPKYFFSTNILAEFLVSLNLEGKNFCEVGAGSGLLSFLAYQKGAEVVCFDLNETAVEGIIQNFNHNLKKKQKFEVYHSDLFETVPPQKFDCIFINPPYFFKEVSDKNSLAWNCGENGEYFEKLFRQISGYIVKKTEIYMILADNCDVEQVRGIAANYNLRLNKILEKKVKWEKNYIFKLELTENFY